MKITVKMTRKENIDHYGGSGPFPLDIEEYLRGVVPAEISDKSHPEALKAQAVAARTYAVKKALAGMIPNDTASNQAYRVSRIDSPNSRKAIEDTAGQVLCYGGEVADCFYSASNGGLTKRSGDVWQKHYPYYVNKVDEWDKAANAEKPTKPSHGVGLSQIGAQWAAKNGVPCNDILAFYYDGASIVSEYGGGVVLYEGTPGEGGEDVLNITKRFMTKNDSYTAGRKINPSGIMVHSTATPGIMAEAWFDRWNRSYKAGETTRQVSVHAFLDDKGVWQYLPWNHRAWHAGGTANNTHIGFEICEPKGHSYAGGGAMVNYNPAKNEAYFRAIWKNAVELCAMLCTMYRIDPMNIIGHYEGARKGIASNHADPGQWFPKHGESMDSFRMAVKQRLAQGGILLPEPDPEEKPGDPNIPDIPIGTIMMFGSDAKRYYPGGTTIPGWVISDYYHIVTAVDSGGKPVIKGGKPCVLLGRRMKKKAGKEEPGIRTWTDVDVLVKVAEPGGVPKEPDPVEPDPVEPDPVEPDPIDPEPEPGEAYFMYTVKKNDTLWGIAREHLGAGALYKQIMALNGLKNDVIRPGQALKIPR